MSARIELSDVSVDFLVHRGAVAAAQAAVDSAEESGSGANFRKVGNRYVATALDGINLTVEPGCRIGIIGHNGSGKSTLLRVLAGVIEPTRGQISVVGRLASMMSTTFGFDMRATGRENIYRRGLMMGMSHAEITERADDIIDFAELGPFIDMPMSTYSAGMRARLGFGITTSMDADIIIMDEWIGAGDQRFIERGRERLMNAIGRSQILLLATHKEKLIREVCDRVLILEKGRPIGFGGTELLDQYAEHLLPRRPSRPKETDAEKAEREKARQEENRLKWEERARFNAEARAEAQAGKLAKQTAEYEAAREALVQERALMRAERTALREEQKRARQARNAARKSSPDEENAGKDSKTANSTED